MDTKLSMEAIAVGAQQPYLMPNLDAMLREMRYWGKVTLSAEHDPDAAMKAKFTLEWSGPDGRAHKIETPCLWSCAMNAAVVVAKQKQDSLRPASGENLYHVVERDPYQTPLPLLNFTGVE